MNPMKLFTVVSSIVLLASPLSLAQKKVGVEGQDFGTLRVSKLTAVVGNNEFMGEHHKGRYNGIFSMTSPDQAESPFVPFYAGINLEHYFDAQNRHPDGNIFFEPREHPMSFTMVNDTTAKMHLPTTPYWQAESNITVEVKEPYYLDYQFRVTPHKKDLAGNLFGVFWASYMNAPMDKSVYFLTGESTLDAPKWQQFYSQVHNRDSVLRHTSDTFEMPHVENPEALWLDESPLRYSEPFYYGRYRNMVFIYIFQSKEIVRFTTSPSGGGWNEEKAANNPAWDFQLLVPDYQVGKEYALDVRVVYKPWVDRDDVLKEVRKCLYLDGE